MKGFSIFLLLFMISGLCPAQVNFEPSLEAARKLSADRRKPLLIFADGNYSSKEIDLSKLFARKGPGRRINPNYISVRFNREAPAYRELLRKLQISDVPRLLVLDPEGGPVRSILLVMDPEQLYRSLTSAIQESKNTSLAVMDELYAEGDNSTAFLEAYLDKRIRAGITNNAKLLDTYAGVLSDESMDYQHILTILESGPLVNGTAFRMINSSPRLVDSIIQNEAPEVVQNIVRNTARNTLATAISDRNELMARTAAEFIKVSNAAYEQMANKLYLNTMVEYYQAVGDTLKLLELAAPYYEQFMKVTPDSLNRKASLMLGFDINQVESDEGSTSVLEAMGATVAADLYEGASIVYNSGTSDPVYLYKAIQWLERAVKLISRPHYYHTLGMLYYRMGVYADAEACVREAIRVSRKGPDRDRYQTDLQQILERTKVTY